MGDGAAPAVAIAWGEAAGSDLTPAVTRVEVEDHDRMIDEAKVTLDDAHQLAANGFAPGQRLTVAIGWERELTRIFEGRIVRTGGSAGAGGGLTLVAHDLSAAMNATPRGRPFAAGLQLSGIVSTIAAEYATTVPVGAVECDPDPTFAAPNVPHQVDRTDFAFLQELAATWGARCFVEVNDDRSQFYFKSVRALWAAAPLAALRFCRGWGNVHEFTYERVAARAARQLVAVAQDPRTGEPARQEGTTPPATPPATGSLRSDLATSEPGLATVNEQATAVAVATPAAETGPRHLLGLPSDPARAAAAVVTDPTRVSGLRGCAKVAGHAGLRAKGRVTVEGIAPWAEGDWWVAKARHVWQRSRDGGRGSTATWVTELEVTR